MPPEKIWFHSVSQAGCEQSSHSLLRIIYELLSLETWPGFRPSLCTGNLSLWHYGPSFVSKILSFQQLFGLLSVFGKKPTVFLSFNCSFHKGWARIPSSNSLTAYNHSATVFLYHKRYRFASETIFNKSPCDYDQDPA